MTFAVRTLGLAPDFVDYRAAWDLQRQLHEQVRSGSAPSTLLLLEHSPVYTAGKRTEDFERPADGTEVIDIDRGGRITWHGPGQLVAYFIYRLRDPKDVRLFVDQVEEAVLGLLPEYGIEGQRVEGRSGVWLPAGAGRPERKIAAVGIRIHEGVTMHGLSLNCSNDSAGFDAIVPCGIPDAGVTTMSEEAGRTIAPADVADELASALNRTITA
ncbi:lipoyl(octanoyl) transferase LipB [Brevibacterium sp. 5221]|uniref:Octanoyltransferase n=1 Tax=Brevibacterium rongguiense TaxID=2695267 RepID=A0A6N9H567_9MICO|nr:MULTISPECIES: lipoyl(octanoyl) transferase LipB [Brevibacterium]MYM18981.1 lipoyl(octanoyl) transferase LipB [Brevibacterium rongguiense]WAL40728.1 lipoyl(octanoyl) transferase LipB [Brevibacterium sp. BRM-1]